MAGIKKQYISYFNGMTDVLQIKGSCRMMLLHINLKQITATGAPLDEALQPN